LQKDRADPESFREKTPSKRQEFIMIHMSANLTVSVVFGRGWLAIQKISKESLDGLFQPICPANNGNLMQLVSK